MTRPYIGPMEIKVLDDGFIRYVDHMGSDEDIVQSARVSTGRGFISWGPYKRCKKCGELHAGLNEGLADYDCGSTDFEKFPRGDLGVLNYMMANRHTSPFEMVEIKVHVRCPMDVWRQWIRHRTANVQEYSTRYSEAIDSMMRTPPDKWRTQGTSNRQGSGAYLPAGEEREHVNLGRSETPGRYLSMRESDFQEMARNLYEERLALGVAKEQARKDLPLSTYTEAYWKIDLHNLFHFLGLRMDGHAQEEIRAYANALFEVAKTIAPRSCELFEEHILYGVRLSRSQVQQLREHLSQGRESTFDVGSLLKMLGGGA